MTEADRRRAAIGDLEGAFSSLIADFRAMYAQMASTVSPGMLPGTYKVLSTIDRRGPVSASWLAEHLALDIGEHT